jgi:hypothetical protein
MKLTSKSSQVTAADGTKMDITGLRAELMTL